MALRLILEATGDTFKLVRKQRVDMLPPAPATDVDPQREDVYAQVRGPNDEPLYQQSIAAQLEPTMELFSPDRTIQRVDAPHPRIVMLIVPDDQAARSIVFLRTRPARLGAGEGRLRQQSTSAPEELGRIALDEDRE